MDVSQLIQAAASVVAAQAVGQVAARLHRGSPLAGGAAAGPACPPSTPGTAGLSALLGGGGASLPPAVGAAAAASQAMPAFAAPSPLAGALAAAPSLPGQAPAVLAAPGVGLLASGETITPLEALHQLQSAQSAQMNKLLAEQQRQQLQLQSQKQQLELLLTKSNLLPSSSLAAVADTENTTADFASKTQAAQVTKAAVPAQVPALKSPSEVKNTAQADARAEAERARLLAKQEALAKAQEVEKAKCHLHKKPKDGCKFCRRHQDLLNNHGQDEPGKRHLVPASQERRRHIGAGSGVHSPDSDPLIEIANRRTYGLTSTVQAHILDAKYYENALMPMQSVGELIDEAQQYVKSVEPYMPDSTTMPSPFFCLVYRLFTLGITCNQMQKLLESSDSPYVRCMCFVYLRFGLQADHLWGWLGEYVLDDEEFQPTAGTSSWTTIGDFVEALLIREKYYSTLLPRVSGGVRRTLEEKLAPVSTYRKRMVANRGLIEIYRRMSTRVEVCLDSTWHEATTLDVEDHPSRPKVIVQLVGGDGADQAVHLGMIILCEELPRSVDAKAHHQSSRSRSRSREHTDWSRCRGKSTSALVEELRQGARERAVCSSGKDYGRRPSTFDKGLAQPREGQGVAARRLLEEETFVKVRSERRNPSPPRAEKDQSNRPSVEHQERMRQLYEKYCSVQDKRPKRGGERSDPNLDGPDLLRLG